VQARVAQKGERVRQPGQRPTRRLPGFEAPDSAPGFEAPDSAPGFEAPGRALQGPAEVGIFLVSGRREDAGLLLHGDAIGVSRLTGAHADGPDRE